MRLAEFDARIDRLSFPATTADVLAAIGNDVLDFHDGAEPVEEILGQTTFDSPDDLRMTLYGSLPGETVGRRGYTDRDPPGVEEFDPVSF